MEPEVKLTEKIYSFLKEQCHQMPQNSKETKEIHKFIEKEPQPSSIPFRIVRYAFTEHKNTAGKKKVYLNELLEGSDLHLPEIIPPPRNLELEARIKKLKLEQQNKIYKDITRNVSIEQDKPDESIQHDLKLMNNQIISVINFIITVGGAFAFGYKATEYMFQGRGNTFPAQMMMGLILGTIVFFADLYFLVKY